MRKRSIVIGIFRKNHDDDDEYKDNRDVDMKVTKMNAGILQFEFHELKNDRANIMDAGK